MVVGTRSCASDFKWAEVVRSNGVKCSYDVATAPPPPPAIYGRAGAHPYRPFIRRTLTC
ncbi:hypothetical protein DES53_12118 [Roseimicrobium gellanilyticum]|uniref:Uncharacterized protein n=1 Tax=Roseimicrobium gellanilyticum TaxID=748857 RepID=A0A366H362_9BACT|nr:hypothetical protein DES53_12118 [Roseimicrobium gellanilyticum]